MIFWTKNWPLIPGFSKIDKENLIEHFFLNFFYSSFIIFCILKQKKCGFSNFYIFEIIPLLWHSAALSLSLSRLFLPLSISVSLSLSLSLFLFFTLSLSFSLCLSSSLSLYLSLCLYLFFISLSFSLYL